MTSLPASIVKRDGRVVPFDLSKVSAAIQKCYDSLESGPTATVHSISSSVAALVHSKFTIHSGGFHTPTVEQVQDLVELALLRSGEHEAARHYITYREQHAAARVVVPAEVQDIYAQSASYFPTSLQQFMFYDKYSRFNWDLMRRETWPETVSRVVAYLYKLSGGALDSRIYHRMEEMILKMQVMPSMRALAMAGPAAERDSTSIYNCSYMPVRDIASFQEAMLISLAGCGVGFSVERENIEQFSRVSRQRTSSVPAVLTVPDTSEGWGQAVEFGLELWMDGYDCTFDYSEIRPAGTPLHTKGGTASGPEPLRYVLDFLRKKMLSRQGTFLRTIDAHDMMCVVGGAAVSGGVRRTAMISLFDWDDSDMLTCKDGAQLDQHPWRRNANNSAVWPDNIDAADVTRQMLAMYDSRRGEPAIYSRSAAIRTSPSRRSVANFGTNPCGEIILRPYEFCNLSIAVARPHDQLVDLLEKVDMATVIGTIQSMATTFPGLRPEWQANAVEERLLGVDITGQRDCYLLRDAELAPRLELLHHQAIKTNRDVAEALGISPSSAITCNKPNGNSSQLLGTSSGIHVRWSQYYVRNIRVSPHTPIFKVLQRSGTPMSPENGQNPLNATSWVVHFPVKSPAGYTRHGVTAIDQCEYWLANKTHWTDHNPSATITYQPDELPGLIQWVWEHREVIGGLSFLPADDAQYDQMPYEEITAEEYEKLASAFPPIDFSLLWAYEKQDMTTSAQEPACVAGSCEL